MGSKEIKSILKSIKEDLDQKNYKSAVKQCKTVLKIDKNNFLALVFYGAAVQETEDKDQAQKAFKKAIEISPDHILGWKGLATYYEKNSNSKDLLEVYANLLIIENDVTKLPEVTEKFEKLAISLGDLSSVKLLIDALPKFSEEKKILLQKTLVLILAQNANLPENLTGDYQQLLSDLLSIKPHIENFLDILTKYLKLLYKQKYLKELILEGTKVIELYPNNLPLLEWICKAYTELPDDSLKDFSPKSVYESLLQIQEDSYLGFFCKGIHELQNGDYLSACDSLKEAVKLKSNAGSLWMKLCICQIFLYRFSDAEDSSLEALKYFERTEKNKDNLLICEINLLKSLCEQDIESKWFEAETLGNKLYKLNPTNIEILQYLTKSLLKIKKFSDAEKHINYLIESKEYSYMGKFLHCLCLKYQNKFEECKEELEKLIVEVPNFCDPWLELGKIHYQENNSESCLFYFLKSTKLNQWCYQNFLFLGNCYRKMIKDLDKARRCYQKAFQLNPSNPEVGINLSDVYRILGKEDLNVQLLTTATSLNPKSKWAWLKLGLHYLTVNQQRDAVNSLRVAVRLDQNDKNIWEYLGDAYFSQGSYTSALKSYQKVQELDPNCIYSGLQIATIKHMTGCFIEAVEEFRILNNQTPNYIPALKGHSEACLSLMKQYLSQNRNGLAHDACQEAVTNLIKCLKQREDLICIWKLLGDACTLLSILPENYCTLKVPSWFFVDSKHQNIDNDITLDKLKVLKLGCRSYCQAVAVNSGLPNLWYDLAFIYNSMVQVSKTEKSRKEMRELACSTVQKSILLDDNSWESWNLYGIILASKEIQNYRLAQHCFIKAIQKQDTNPITWTNLGTLYLNLDDLQIANQSFTEAQKCDYDYVLCWVGQAIIAQRTGHHDSMDLYRHSTQLGFSYEGSLGYANKVCDTLLNTKDKNNKNYVYSIKNMNAVCVASNVLTWYTDRVINNGWAFNMLGLLLERQKIYGKAAEAFANALDLIQAEKVTEEKKEYHSNIVDKVLLNYGRVLSKLKKYDDAITYLKQITKATFTNQCEMAIAYFRAKLYEEAYSSYETTLEWLAPNSEVKSHILVAMAAVVYLHQGQEDAKILLMQSFQLKPPSIHGLFASCALGLLHSDLALSELVLKELNQFKDDLRYLEHIAIFQAYIYLFKGLKEKAIKALCKVIYRHPSQPSLWQNLSILILYLYPSFDSRSAACCAEVALHSGRSSIDVSKVMSLVSFSHLLSGQGLKSLRSSQKAVHMFPDVTENWVVLVASVLSKCLVQESREELFWLKKMITYIRRKFESSKTMTQWLSNNNRKIDVMVDKLAS